VEIKLRINGEDKTFVQEFAPLGIYRKALELEKYADSEEADPLKLFDKRLNLIVEIFGKQFTKDELENGMNVIGHQREFYNIVGVGVLGYRTLEEQEQLGESMQELERMMSEVEKSQSTNA